MLPMHILVCISNSDNSASRHFTGRYVLEFVHAMPGWLHCGDRRVARHVSAISSSDNGMTAPGLSPKKGLLV